MSNILSPPHPFMFMCWPTDTWSGALPQTGYDAYLSGANGWTYTVATNSGALSSSLAGAILNTPVTNSVGSGSRIYFTAKLLASNGETGGASGLDDIMVGVTSLQGGGLVPGNGFTYPVGGLDGRSVGVGMIAGKITGPNNGPQASLGAATVGDTYEFVVDFTIGKLWIRNQRLGLWNGDVLANQNPNGNIGGFGTGIGAAYGFIMVTSRNCTTGSSVFVNLASGSAYGATPAVSGNVVAYPTLMSFFDSRTAQWQSTQTGYYQTMDNSSGVPSKYASIGGSQYNIVPAPAPTRNAKNIVLSGFPNTVPSTNAANDGLTITSPEYDFHVSTGYSPASASGAQSILSTAPVSTSVAKFYFEVQVQFDPYGNSLGAGSGLVNPLDTMYYLACASISNGNPFSGEGLGGIDGVAVNFIAGAKNTGLSTIVNNGKLLDGGTWSPVAPNIGDWIGIGVEVTTSDYINIPGLAGNLWVRNITQQNALQKGLLIPTIYYQVELDGQIYVGDYPTLPNLALTYGPGVGSPDRVYVGDYPVLGKVLQTINAPTNPDNLWTKLPFATGTTGGSCFIGYGHYQQVIPNAFLVGYKATTGPTQLRYNLGSYPFQGQPPPGFSPATQIVTSGTVPPTLQSAAPRAIPSPVTIPTDQNGRVTPEWARFFAKIYQDPVAGYPINFGSGGVTQIAPITPGTLYINGGANVVATIARGVTQAPVSLPINSSGQTIVLYPGDAVNISYSSAPQGYFLSS